MQTFADAATFSQRYKISRVTFWRIGKEPGCPAPIRFGRAVRWNIADMDAYLAQRGARQ